MIRQEREADNGSKEKKPRWSFYNCKFTENSTKTPLTPEQKGKEKDYIDVLQTALSSRVPHPTQSGFTVQEAIGPIGGLKIPAGNIEYGYKNAIHGEESAANGLRLKYPEYRGDLVLGIVTDNLAKPASPCGNCRDVLIDLLDGDVKRLEVVSGFEKGEALVASFEDYLYEDYKLIHDGGRHLPAEREVKVIRDLEKVTTFAPLSEGETVSSQRTYTACVKTESGMYIGGHIVDDDYHPVYALRNALIQSRNNTKIVHIVIVTSNSEGLPPKVMYSDRQALLTQLKRGMEKNGEQNPPIFLINDFDSKNLKIWMTTPKDWLPNPSTFIK
jgi:cytidine deaminase